MNSRRLLPMLSKLAALFVIVAAIVVAPRLLPISSQMAGLKPMEGVAAATLMEGEAGTTLLSYQGRISNPSTGQPLADGSYGVNFFIFDAPSDGNQFWTEARSAQQTQGLFTLLLGEVTPLPLNIFDGRDLYLQLQVNGEMLTSRQRIAWVAYAINARQAETVKTDAILSSMIRDGQVSSADIADGTIGTADIAGNSINADHIQDLQRSITIPADALNWNRTTPTAISNDTGAGLVFAPSFSGGAFVLQSRPADWDGTSNVTMSIHFISLSPFTSVGNVDFFIRPRSYNSGDTFADVSSKSSNGVLKVSAFNQFFEQTFTIPASLLQKSTWVIGLQRHSGAETYTGDVAVMDVKLTYNANR